MDFARLVIRWGDIRGLRRFDNVLKSLDRQTLVRVLVPAVNRAGDMAKTQVTRALTEQTGIKRKVIVKAIKVKRAGHNLEYEMRTRGGDISLKYFDASETAGGVSAAPFGQRRVFGGAFMKGGRFPNRVTAKGLNGHVYRRVGKGRGPLDLLDSGVIIPEQMLQGKTAATFQRVVAEVLPRRVEHELRRIIG